MTHENVLARYKVLQELGRGAISAVYSARDRRTGAGVALKRLDPALLNGSNRHIAERFLKDARAAGLLKHRNIVEIYEAGEAGGTAYVAMEMLEGESLRSILDRGPLPVARAIRIAHDIASGLAHAHLQGTVHGGIQPSNVVVLRSGTAKITDFGIGHAALLSAAPGARLGYSSPEQLRGEPVDHRCDVFSLGALLHEMLTGRPAFQGNSAKEILQKMLHAEPPRPSDLNPHVPRALDVIIRSMIAGQADRRTAGMPLVVRDLQRIQEGLGLESAANAGADEPAVPAPAPHAVHVPQAVAVPQAAAPAPSAAAPAPPAAPTPQVAPAPRVAPPPQAAPAPPARPRPAERPQESPRTNAHETFDYQAAIAIMERESRTQRSSRSRPAVLAAFVLGFAALGIGVAGFLGVGVTGFMDRVGLAGFVNDWLDPIKQGITASRLQEAPAAAPVASRPAVPSQLAEMPQKVAEAAAPVASRPARPSPVAEAPQKVAEAPRKPVTAPAPDPVPPPPPMAAQPAPRPVAPPPVAEMAQEPTTASAPQPPPAQPAAPRAPPAPQLTSAVQPTAERKEQQPGATARLVVAVSPRGEIYIDGKHHGTTPPVTTLDLEPGMHQIEIRSGSRKPYLTYMVVQAGDVRRIRHDFNAKPSGPKTASRR